jgi:PHD/YefM family antitoxin component YafN of YafNO toxin-antitoxin module
MVWNIATAKSKLSELITISMVEPQIIYNRKHPTAVLMKYEEFIRLRNLETLIHKSPKWMKFTEFSKHFSTKKSIEIELPNRKDREVLNF